MRAASRATVAAGVRGRAEPDPGVRLTEDAQPGLWAELRELAAGAGAEPPDEVLLVPAVAVSLARRGGRLRARHSLRIGAPLLFGLTRDQALELIGHRLGGDATEPAALPVVQAAWAHFVDEVVGRAHATGRRPDALFEGFGEVVESPTLRPLLDTGGPPALVLLDRPDTALHALQEWMYVGTGLVATSWDDLLHRQDDPELRARARELYAAAARVEGRPVPLGSLVSGARNGKLRRYVRELDPTADEVELAAARLGDAVAEVLISTRDASLTHTFDAGSRLVDADGATLHPGPLVEQAVSGLDPAPLEGWLADQRADPAYVPVPETYRPRPDASPHALVAGAAPVSGEGARWLVVLRGGLLLREATARDRRDVLTTGGSPGRAMVARLAATSYAELVDQPGSTWVPWAAIERVEVRRRRGGGTQLRIRFTAGGDRKVRLDRATRVHGNLFGALSEHLGERLVPLD